MNKIRSAKRKLAFKLGLNPLIEKAPQDKSRFIPKPYQAVMIFSADLELAWGWQYAKSAKNPGILAVKKANQARENIPVILHFCDQFNIPVTWATVGHLFLEGCQRKNGVVHGEISRMPHFENNEWKFDSGDWFQHDPGDNWQNAPAWYAPDIVHDILRKNPRHEIACHTFSHIDCREMICPAETFESEINACKRAAAEFDIKLASFVHPGHTIGNLNTLKGLGFTSFRSAHKNILGYPKLHKSGLWELQSSKEMAWRKGWSEKYQLYQYKEIIRRALKHNMVCYFWFHPSLDPRFLETLMPAIFEFASSLRREILITNTKDYIQWLGGASSNK